MNIEGLKGTYDGIFSLGENCLPSIQLENNGLRPFAGVLDWLCSQNLDDVNQLLKNRFEGFMDKENLQFVSQISDKLYFVHETKYNVYSNHDFFTHENTPEHLEAQPKVKAKFDRRIGRFLDKLSTGKRLLFVRCNGTYEDAIELQTVLRGMIKNDFKVLLIQHTSVTTLTDNNWPLENVCGVEIPALQEPFVPYNDHFWKQLFEGIEYAE